MSFEYTYKFCELQLIILLLLKTMNMIININLLSIVI